MTSYFDPFGAKVWNLIQLSHGDDWGLYCSGRRNRFGTTLAARGSKAELDKLIASSCLVL